MAHLVRQQKTYYVNADGKRVPKGTRGAKKVTEKSAKWYGTGVPGQPPRKRIPLATDKEAARRMLDDMCRRAERGEAGLLDRDAGRKPLSEYLTAFRADLALGLATKRGKQRRPPSEPQVKLIVQRVEDSIAACGLTHPTDLNSAAPAKLATYLRGRLNKSRTLEEGISAQTATFFLAAMRRFVRWISTRAAVRPDLLDALPGFDPGNDRKHARREISPEELAALITCTRESGVTIRGLTGPDRAMLYLTAFATGYRAGELAKLTRDNFELDAEIPIVVLPAKFTKNKKSARQPIPVGLAAQLREFLADRATGKPVWSGTWPERPVSVLRRDLVRAGVVYCLPSLDGPKYADFHALRHSYLSALAAAGVGVKELQTLARHSDPRLTIGIYTHTRAESLGASVARLQLPGTENQNPLAKFSRAELESAVIALAAVVVTVLGPQPAAVTPRVTPTAETSGNPWEPSGTRPGNVATG